MITKDQITYRSSNAEILEAYAEELKIPKGENCSSVLCIDLPTREELNGGAPDKIQPVFVQKRNDARVVNSANFHTQGQQAAFNELRGSSINTDRLLRVIFAPMSQEDLDAVGIEPGSTLDASFNIDVIRSTKPFYSTQSPMVYPAGSNYAGQIITSDGKPVYENSFVTKGNPTFEGMDLPLDTAKLNVAGTTTKVTQEVA